MMQVVAAVAAVLEVLEAKNRIPDDLKNTHPYSVMTLWTYYALGDVGSNCNYCKMFDGQTFTGDQLRTTFPDHIWQGTDIYPNVHMTLWGKDTCKCLLIREPDEVDVNLSMWSNIGVDWKDAHPSHDDEPTVEPDYSPKTVDKEKPNIKPSDIKNMSVVDGKTYFDYKADRYYVDGVFDDADDLWDLVALGLLDLKKKKNP